MGLNDFMTIHVFILHFNIDFSCTSALHIASSSYALLLVIVVQTKFHYIRTDCQIALVSGYNEVEGRCSRKSCNTVAS